MIYRRGGARSGAHNVERAQEKAKNERKEEDERDSLVRRGWFVVRARVRGVVRCDVLAGQHRRLEFEAFKVDDQTAVVCEEPWI